MNFTQKQLLAGVVVIVLIVIAIFVIHSSPQSATSEWTATTTSATSTKPATPTKKPTGVQPASPTTTTTVSDSDIPKATTVNPNPYLKKDATQVYVYAGVDPTGHDQYAVIPGADPKTFVAISDGVVVEKPTEKNGAAILPLGLGSATYYKDSGHVYVFSMYQSKTEAVKVGMQVVPGADPASFKVLSPIYAEDVGSVYALVVPADAPPHQVDSYTWHSYNMKQITEADLATFTLSTSATATYDAHDKNRTYLKGVTTGAYSS